jgi:Leucine-rich repeat (LRR) protein
VRLDERSIDAHGLAVVMQRLLAPDLPRDRPPLKQSTAGLAGLKLLEDVPLRSLHLSNNELLSLPADICAPPLRSLTTLNVGYNLLSTLPPQLCELPALVSLFAHNNRLQQLPSEIGALHTLEYLYCDYNMLRALPPSIVDLPCLRTLWLHANPCRKTDLPKALRHLETLASLKLSCGEHVFGEAGARAATPLHTRRRLLSAGWGAPMQLLVTQLSGAGRGARAGGR